MALITVSGATACRLDEVGRLTAQRLGFEFLSESILGRMVAEEFGAGDKIPDRAWPQVLGSIVARLATENRLVIVARGSELLFKNFPGRLRVYITAPESRRIGNLMVERKLERPSAKSALTELERLDRELRRRRFRVTAFRPEQLDIVLNEDTLEPEAIAAVIAFAADAAGLRDGDLLSSSVEAQLQFQFRLQLSKHGIAPPGDVKLKRVQFGHPSEEIFANLLEFYRIAWEYEARSFPIQWDKDGNVLEAFTPDFYLPEFDLYVELTTMKQANVTKKNRKVKLLRAIYPHINIQVFYQKDFQNLIFKHGLHEPAAAGGAKRS